eukprot:TRINITY_DN71604_c0_g1_i1.p1 TRINITY_DN71604_c0_g1~~TRINITY_DN71604_c0_g1_i1.p1  ORF type:complete len:104 (-),score=2.57 TRINITY_DN71604_c0_g1_i1:132-443(-)
MIRLCTFKKTFGLVNKNFKFTKRNFSSKTVLVQDYIPIKTLVFGSVVYCFHLFVVVPLYLHVSETFNNISKWKHEEIEDGLMAAAEGGEMMEKAAERITSIVL